LGAGPAVNQKAGSQIRGGFGRAVFSYFRKRSLTQFLGGLYPRIAYAAAELCEQTGACNFNKDRNPAATIKARNNLSFISSRLTPAQAADPGKQRTGFSV
jgi:hypothetical protein